MKYFLILQRYSDFEKTIWRHVKTISDFCQYTLPITLKSDSGLTFNLGIQYHIWSLQLLIFRNHIMVLCISSYLCMSTQRNIYIYIYINLFTSTIFVSRMNMLDINDVHLMNKVRNYIWHSICKTYITSYSLNQLKMTKIKYYLHIVQSCWIRVINVYFCNKDSDIVKTLSDLGIETCIMY